VHLLPLSYIPPTQSDYRLYRAANGLLCLLISDDQASQATAVLQVGVGSHAEPAGLPGLAHLLEHLLFMGSAGYPQPGAFPARIARWGGRFNASTANQATRYFFSLAPAGLDESLHQLADMLAAPCFHPAQVASEREVIEAEFRTRLADDALHEQAALAQIFNPAHPLSRFTAGNRQSLRGTPEALASALHDWHRGHYRAGAMALVLHAPRSPDQLRQLAERTAAQLPAGTLDQHRLPPLFCDGALPTQLDWRGPGAQDDCTLWYPLSDCAPDSIATRWLCEWVNSAAPAGALGYLRRQAGLAELRATVETGAEGQALLRIDLATLPERPVLPLLAALDAWLRAMTEQNPGDWPQTHRQQLAHQLGGNGPQGDPLDWCRRYAERLLTLSPEQVLDLSGTQLPLLTRQAWRELLRQLQPNARLLVCRRSRLDAAAQALWTATPFTLRPLAVLPDQLRVDLALLPWPSLQPLPPAPAGLPWGGYLPGLRLGKMTPPSANRSRTRLAWAWPAGETSQAERSWLLACWSVQGEALAQWGQLLGLTLRWQLVGELLQLDAAGPADQLPGFLRELLTALQRPPAAEQLALIEYRRQQWHHQQTHALPAYRLLQQLDGADAAQAEVPAERWASLCSSAQLYWLKPQGWPEQERSMLAKLLINLCPALLRPLRLEAPAARKPRVQASDVPCQHADRAQLLYLQAEHASAEEDACWRLLHHCLADAFFAELRTRQQLGYWVVARLRRQHGRAGLLLLVQSPSHPHAAIEAAISDFLQHQGAQLAALSTTQLQQHCTHLADLLQQQREDPDQQFEAHWQDCLQQTDDHLGAEQAALQTLSLAAWQDFMARLPRCPRWHLRSAN